MNKFTFSPTKSKKSEQLDLDEMNPGQVGKTSPPKKGAKGSKEPLVNKGEPSVTTKPSLPSVRDELDDIEDDHGMAGGQGAGPSTTNDDDDEPEVNVFNDLTNTWNPNPGVPRNPAPDIAPPIEAQPNDAEGQQSDTQVQPDDNQVEEDDTDSQEVPVQGQNIGGSTSIQTQNVIAPMPQAPGPASQPVAQPAPASEVEKAELLTAYVSNHLGSGLPTSWVKRKVAKLGLKLGFENVKVSFDMDGAKVMEGRRGGVIGRTGGPGGPQPADKHKTAEIYDNFMWGPVNQDTVRAAIRELKGPASLPTSSLKRFSKLGLDLVATLVLHGLMSGFAAMGFFKGSGHDFGPAFACGLISGLANWLASKDKTKYGAGLQLAVSSFLIALLARAFADYNKDCCFVAIAQAGVVWDLPGLTFTIAFLEGFMGLNNAPGRLFKGVFAFIGLVLGLSSGGATYDWSKHSDTPIYQVVCPKQGVAADLTYLCIFFLLVITALLLKAKWQHNPLMVMVGLVGFAVNVEVAKHATTPPTIDNPLGYVSYFRNTFVPSFAATATLSFVPHMAALLYLLLQVMPWGIGRAVQYCSPYAAVNEVPGLLLLVPGSLAAQGGLLLAWNGFTFEATGTLLLFLIGIATPLALGLLVGTGVAFVIYLVIAGILRLFGFRWDFEDAFIGW